MIHPSNTAQKDIITPGSAQTYTNISAGGAITPTIDCSRFTTINFQITSISGTSPAVSVRVSNDPTFTTFAQVPITILNGTTPNQYPYVSVNGVYYAPTFGCQYFQLYNSSGSNTITSLTLWYVLSTETQPQFFTLSPKSTNFGISYVSTSATAATFQSSSAGTSTSVANPYSFLVASGARTLLTVAATNDGNNVAYLKLFNSGPTLGTSFAFFSLFIPKGGQVVYNIGPAGMNFGTSLYAGITGGPALNDATAVATGTNINAVFTYY